MNADILDGFTAYQLNCRKSKKEKRNLELQLLCERATLQEIINIYPICRSYMDETLAEKGIFIPFEIADQEYCEHIEIRFKQKGTWFCSKSRATSPTHNIGFRRIYQTNSGKLILITKTFYVADWERIFLGTISNSTKYNHYEVEKRENNEW